MTTLTYLGHACFLFETDHAALLIDPWLSPRGAFLGTWRQLPPNDHALSWLLDKVKLKPTLVYVTHEHEDHYDEETLLQILPHADGIQIADFECDFFRRRIKKALKAEPKLTAENDIQRFHDIEFRVFIDESGINRDSAVFVKSKDFSFFDGNDCKIFDRAGWLAGQCGTIDVMSSQFSGANMHPICYDMTPEEYRLTSRQKKMRKYVAARDFIHNLNPKYFIPSAGPAVFAYPQHEHLNFEEETIFPKWWEFQSYMQSKGSSVVFTPLRVMGSMTKGGAGDFKVDGIADKITNDEIKEIIGYYRSVDAKTMPSEKITAEEVLTYFEREMNAKIDVLRKMPDVKFACSLYFDIQTDKDSSVTYCIHPERKTLEKASLQSIVEPYYLHRTSIEALAQLKRSGKGWGTYFLSFLFRNRRVPDKFDSALGTFFVANDADELEFGLRKLSQFRSSSEYITLTADDGVSSVTCKRFCPHQGADLKYAKFDGKYVVCPRHQWRFDCQNGGKADNSSDTIDAVISKKEAG